MKPSKLSLLNSALFVCAAVAAAAVMLASSASAQPIAYDDAGNYVVSANWTSGANLGFGFTPWVIVTNGPDSHGTYIGSANIPTFVIASVTNVMGTNYTCVWGTFANGLTDQNETTAFRGFANPLGTNTFKLQWGSRGAGVTTTTNQGVVHGWCGFGLRYGNSNTNTAYIYPLDPNGFEDSTLQFYLYFRDGNAPATIYYRDASGVQSVPGTSFSNLGRGNITNAIEAEITPGSDGSSYHLVLKDCVQNMVLYTANGNFINPGQGVASAALFNYETTGDTIYNRMQIASPTNIPPSISNVQPPDGSLYQNANSTTLSFEVDSFNSSVSSNAVSVYLNGVLQTGFTYNTTAPTSQLTASGNPALTADTFYTYTIVAHDANGNVVSNNYTFNTFLPTDIYIDAYDYNYQAGQFINTNTPINAYANLLGTNFIDYQIADLTGTNNTAGYRPGDLVEILTLATDATGDPIDHANLRANGHTAYNIGFTDTGNWENYTRNFPPTNYTIYARAASGGGGQFEIERLANATATTTNQPLAALGRFNVPVTGGSKVFTGQLIPLTDFFGNTVVVPLSGTNTLRETALASRAYNLEYLVAVASAAGNLGPYISVGSPAPNATGVLLTSPISFTLVNRQTSVLTNSIRLLLNSTNQTALLLTSNAAGVTVTWTPNPLLPISFTNTVTVIFTNSANVAMTDSWSFVTGTSGGLPGIYQSGGPGTTYTDRLGDGQGSANLLRDISFATISNDAVNLYITLGINPAGNIATGGAFNYIMGITTGNPAAGGDTLANVTTHGNPYSRDISFDSAWGGMTDFIGIFGANGSGSVASPYTSYGFNDYVWNSTTLTWSKIDTVSSNMPISMQPGTTTNNQITITVPLSDFASNLPLTPGTTIYFDIDCTGTGAGQTAYDSLANQSVVQPGVPPGTSGSGYSGTYQYNTTILDQYTIGPLPAPTLRNATVSNGQLVINGTNNYGGGGSYHVLTATNLAVSRTNWTVLTNGNFSVNGNFSFTNSPLTNSQRFYILTVP